ncbi:hypothetical protein FOMG_18994 [Fusarium oxysporum f. sp. melonis 26406]|uniref:Uncharacterized protein n=1 Tax=Fusarium oxysporum f. sp. melonis 26406 TaxID=1089452 RepID=W9Z6N1_FUSOX|nr:hypothetical protein FOMG_18994 [Fusarium oxysporum f. sp. melonis 26406]
MMHQSSLDSSWVILQEPGNWKLWINIIQKFATAYNIWEFIDPSKVEKAALLKPEEPNLPRYQSRGCRPSQDRLQDEDGK